MAIIKPGNGSSLSGLVGGVVIVQTKRGSYMRSTPKYTKSSWTEKQKAHRQRFKMVSKFCNQFKETVISQIWKGADEWISGRSLFLKTNMAAFSPQGELAEPARLQLSTGPLTLPQGLELSLIEGEDRTVTVSWLKGSSGGMSLRDELMVVSAGEGIYSEILNTGLLRGHLGGTFELPEVPASATHLYLFFGSRDRRSYSVSECFAMN